MPLKRNLIESMMNRLKQELETLVSSARAAHEAATHEESKAEDSHDTRGLEASYLAAGQASRIESLNKDIYSLQQWVARNFEPNDAIEVGALVELESDGKRSQCFLVSHGGGMTIPFEGGKVQVITPQSPMGQALLGRHQGDVIEVEAQKNVREYEVILVR